MFAKPLSGVRHTLTAWQLRKSKMRWHGTYLGGTNIDRLRHRQGMQHGKVPRFKFIAGLVIGLMAARNGKARLGRAHILRPWALLLAVVATMVRRLHQRYALSTVECPLSLISLAMSDLPVPEADANMCAGLGFPGVMASCTWLFGDGAGCSAARWCCRSVSAGRGSS